MNQETKRNVRELGLFEAKAINSYTISNEKGASACIDYEYKDGDKLKRITGIFSLNGEAVKWTLEKLRNSGYLFGDENLVDFHEGQGFDKDVKCQISIIEEEGTDGKWHKKVGFVNAFGSKMEQKKMAKEEHVVKMKGLNISGSIAEFMAKNNIKKPAKKEAEETFDSSNIPF